jgi:hypothetical protein
MHDDMSEHPQQVIRIVTRLFQPVFRFDTSDGPVNYLGVGSVYS